MLHNGGPHDNSREQHLSDMKRDGVTFATGLWTPHVTSERYCSVSHFGICYFYLLWHPRRVVMNQKLCNP